MESTTIYPLANMPRGLTWQWFEPNFLVVEANLDAAGRRQAIDEAFADARAHCIYADAG